VPYNKLEEEMISENLFSSGFLYVVLYDIPLVWNWN